MKNYLLKFLITATLLVSLLLCPVLAETTPTSSSEAQSTATPSSPSVIPPMVFKVTSAGGDDIVLENSTNNSAEVKFSITGRNGGFNESFTLLKIVNTATGYTYDLGNTQISKGGADWSKTVTAAFNSTDAGETVIFTLYWKDFSGNERTENATLEIKVPDPVITVEAVVDQLSAVPGSDVFIQYEISNIGNVPVKNIVLYDKTVTDITGETFSSEPILQKGAMLVKMATVTLDGQITLEPVVKFTYNGKEYEVSGDTVTLTAEEVIPSITLGCDYYSVAKKGDMLNFNYVIKNTTQFPLTNIRVYDADTESANLVGGPFDLEVDQEYTGTYELPITKSGYYKFKILYTYEGADGDKELSAKTDKQVRLPNEVFMEITNVSPETLTEPGEMTFTLYIENGTSSELRDIVITEESNLVEKSELKNIVIPALKNGNAGVYTYQIKVNIPKTDTRVRFNLSYSINGEISTINATYDVRFVTDQVSASPTATISPTPVPVVNDEGSGLMLWIILGVLLLLILLALILLLIFLKKSKDGDDSPRSVKRKVGTTFRNDNDDDYNDQYDDEYLDNYDEDIPLEPDSLDEEYAQQFEPEDDDYDDDGVKIYKGKK